LRGWREGWVAGPEAGVGCMVDIALGGFLAVGHGEQVKVLSDAGFGCVSVGDGWGAVPGGVVGCWSRFGR